MPSLPPARSAGRSAGRFRDAARSRAVRPITTAPVAAAWVVAIAVYLTAAAALTGCTPGVSPEPETAASAPGAGLVHVHGLGADPGEPGAVYAAAHTGLWRIALDTTGPTWSPTGEPEQVAGRAQDTMGFTVTGEGDFLASGHPDPAEQPDLSPAHLGLVRSSDRALTWESVALRGQVDFHDLEVAPLPDGRVRVVGYDATRGLVMISDDGGATWRDGAALQARDLAVDPRDASTLYATTAQATMASTDAGATFAPLSSPPPGLLLLDAATPAPGASGTLTGIDIEGGVWTAPDPAGPWTSGGALSGDPAALTVLDHTDGTGGQRLLVADDLGIYTTTDAGENWQTLAVTATSGHQ